MTVLFWKEGSPQAPSPGPGVTHSTLYEEFGRVKVFITSDTWLKKRAYLPGRIVINPS